MNRLLIKNETARCSKSQKLIQSVVVLFLSGFALFLFAKRVVFPDISFDTVNYHFFLGKSGFENFPRMFKSSEFFPLGLHSFNPLLDTVNYLVYELLGYRLGTVLSLLALIGSFVLSIGIVFRLTEARLTVVAAIFIIPALTVNEGLFQVATYFTDNHYTFLALSYVYILMGIEKTESSKAFILRLFYLGIVGGLLISKLTNVIYMIPFFLATIYLSLPRLKNLLNDEGGVSKLFIAIFSFSLPAFILPGVYLFDAFQYTGNPVFPYYNSIFKSIYYPYESWQFNFGPTTFIERLAYPFIAFRDPTRLGEVKDLFPDVKLLTTSAVSVILFAVVVVLKVQLNKRVMVFLAMNAGAFIVWQLLFGYSRYAIALEILLGLSVVVLINRIILAHNFSNYAYLILAPLLLIVLMQSISIGAFNRKYDIAWRPLDVTFRQWKDMFFDKSIFGKFTVYDDSLGDKLRRVDVVIQCINPSSMYAQTIPDLHGKPLLNFDKGNNAAMTTNYNYIFERNQRALIDAGQVNGGSLSFAVVLNDTNKDLNSLSRCLDALQVESDNRRSFSIDEKLYINNFVGDYGKNLTILMGVYNLSAKSYGEKF